jgi:hypothetical protein
MAAKEKIDRKKLPPALLWAHLTFLQLLCLNPERIPIIQPSVGSQTRQRWVWWRKRSTPTGLYRQWARMDSTLSETSAKGVAQVS